MGVSPPPFLDEQQQDHMTNLSMLYYSFFVVATAGLLLLVYHCLVVNWCTCASSQSGTDPVNATASVQNFECNKVMEMESTTFEYRKGQEGGGVGDCVICLSCYEDGEQVRKLLRCNHCFHVGCIDMWLYTHFDCPLCRAPVGNIKRINGQSGNLTPSLSDNIDFDL